MSVGTNLLTLQELDLELARTKKELAEMPALRELAKKRKSHARLKSEAVKLMAQRKDAETDLADLDAEERACHEGVAAAQARPLDTGDYRQVQALQDELSGFAKRLDKIAFSRKEAIAALDAAREREQQLAEYIARFETAIVADAKTAREQAAEIQGRIDAATAKREHLISALPAEAATAYAKASERFHSLGVESLAGHVPSICRTTLQPASLDALRRSGEVAECPYCHRILVRVQQEA